MAVKGMDVEAGRQSSTTISQGAESLEQITQQLTSSLKGFEWHGPDADRVRSQWDSEHVRALQTVSGSLREFAQLIGNQAKEQEDVSAR